MEEKVVVEPAVAAEPPFCKKTIDYDKETVTFAFGNGQTRTIALEELADEYIRGQALHGISQRGGDSYAAAGGDYAFALGNLDRTLANIRAGVVRSVRAEGGSTKGFTELVQAVASLMSMPMEEVISLLENASPEVKKALRADLAVKAKIADIRAEKAKEAAAKAGTGGLAALIPQA